MTSTGAIKGKIFKEKERIGRLEIRSNKDLDFSKIIEIKFYNIFPDNFDVYISDINGESNIYTGIPFYINLKIDNYEEHKHKVVDFDFDEKYFKKIGINKFVALQEVASSIIKVTLGDITKEVNVKVKDTNVLDVPNDVKLYTINDILYQVGEPIYFKFLYNDVLTPCCYEIVIENANYDIKANDGISFNSNGNFIIKFIILGNDEYANNIIEKEIYVYPKKENIDLSKIPESITLYQDEDTNIKLDLPMNNLISCDSQNMSISYNYQDKTLNLKSSNIENSTISLELEMFDGENVSSIHKEIKVITLENKQSTAYSNKQISKFVSKIMGHMGLFFIEGLLAIWFIMNHKIQSFNKVLSLFAYVSIGLFIGLLTEFIQIFLEGRNPSFKDVGIDFSGYLIGGLIMVIIYIFTYIAKRNKTKQEQN